MPKIGNSKIPYTKGMSKKSKSKKSYSGKRKSRKGMR
jgi:hypothetical protein